MKVSEVEALEGYRIRVSFDDCINGIIELKDFIQKGIFQVLKNEALFSNVHHSGSAIAWTDELEIDADNIYAEILNEDPQNLFHTPTYHAAD